MKYIRRTLTLVLAVVFTVSTFASNKITEDKYRQIEDNLLHGIKSENLGLQISCAYFLGELKSERAIIPLLKMLKSGATEEERIMAALSLSKIDSDRGIFAIKQKIRFDDSERVQRLCELFYNKIIENELNGNVVVEPVRVVDFNSEYNGMKLSQFASK